MSNREPQIGDTVRVNNFIGRYAERVFLIIGQNVNSKDFCVFLLDPEKDKDIIGYYDPGIVSQQCIISYGVDKKYLGRYAFRSSSYSSLEIISPIKQRCTISHTDT